MRNIRLVRFVPTANIRKIGSYIKFCAARSIHMDSRNLPTSAMETAIGRFCRDQKLALLVDSEKEARVMGVLNGIKVYSINALPKDTIPCVYYGAKDKITVHTVCSIKKDPVIEHTVLERDASGKTNFYGEPHFTKG